MDFKLTPGANNGVGIRIPFEKNNLTYSATKFKFWTMTTRNTPISIPASIAARFTKFSPPNAARSKKSGEWNHYEISAIGRHFKIVLNGQTIVDGNLNDVTNRETLREHPGMLRESGHIALLGHWSYVEFRKTFASRNCRARDAGQHAAGRVHPALQRARFGRLEGLGGRSAQTRQNVRRRTGRRPGQSRRAHARSLEGRGRRRWSSTARATTFARRAITAISKCWSIGKSRPRATAAFICAARRRCKFGRPTAPGNFAQPDGSGGLWNNQKNNRHPLACADHPVGAVEPLPHSDGGREGPCFSEQPTGGARHDAGKLLGAGQTHLSQRARSNCKTTAARSGSRTSTSANCRATPSELFRLDSYFRNLIKSSPGYLFAFLCVLCDSARESSEHGTQ